MLSKNFIIIHEQIGPQSKLFTFKIYFGLVNWSGVGTNMLSFVHLREAAKKNLVARPLREGRGVMAWPIRKKDFFMLIFDKEKSDGH